MDFRGSKRETLHEFDVDGRRFQGRTDDAKQKPCPLFGRSCSRLIIEITVANMMRRDSGLGAYAGEVKTRSSSTQSTVKDITVDSTSTKVLTAVVSLTVEFSGTIEPRTGELVQLLVYVLCGI